MVKAKQLEQLPGMEDPADEATVRALVDSYGYKEAAVLGWGRARAVTVLDARRREEHAILLKQAAEAPAGDAPPPPPRATTGLHREVAAQYIDAALARPDAPDALYFAVSYGVWEFDDSEIRRLAGYVAKALRQP